MERTDTLELGAVLYLAVLLGHSGQSAETVGSFGNQPLFAETTMHSAMSREPTTDPPVRVTSPTPVVASPNHIQVLSTLPAGAVVTVLEIDGHWLRISAVIGAKKVKGYVPKAQTTWQP